MSIFIGLFTINTFKNFGMKNLNDNAYLTTVGAVSAVFGAIRFVWSYLVDRYSFKLSYGIILCINIIFGSTLVLVSKSKALYLIWVCMLVWAEGAHFSLVPTLCAKLFGVHAAMVYGIAFSFGAVAQIISSILVRFTLKSIGYESFYYGSSVLSLLALIVLLAFFKETKIC